MHHDLVEAFRILELDPTDERPVVRAAYIDLVKVWHPDRYQHEGPRLREKAQEKVKRINWAYNAVEKHFCSGGRIDADIDSTTPNPSGSSGNRDAVGSTLRSCPFCPAYVRLPLGRSGVVKCSKCNMEFKAST
jgi:hypothetical protein